MGSISLIEEGPCTGFCRSESLGILGCAAAFVPFVLFDFASLLFVSLLLEDFDFDFAGAFPRPKRPPVGFLVDLDFASFEDVVFALVSFVLLSFAFASFAFASFALVSLFVLGAAAFASLVDVLEVAGLASVLVVETAGFVS